MTFLMRFGLLGAILVWSIAAWVVYTLVEWVFWLIGSVVGGVLGNWAFQLIDWVGDAGQLVVFLVWVVVAVMLYRTRSSMGLFPRFAAGERR